MKRILKWIGLTILSIAIVLALVIYVGSEYRVRQTFDIPATAIAIPTDSASLARGRHIFETRGCEGCHGLGLGGKVFFDEPMIARVVAPNVVRAIRGYGDPDLARLLRHGVRPNGRGVAVMPSAMFYHLDDADLGALIAFLRTLPDKGSDTLPKTSMRVLARVGMVLGQYKMEPRYITHDAPRAPNGADPAARGKYIAKSACTECHGDQLTGDGTTPSLSVVAAYSPVEFARLMREGIPRDGRKLDLMARTARSRFVHLTDDEITALYAYLSGQLASGKTTD